MEIYIVNSMSFDGFGPSQTCINIAEEMSRAGHKVYIFGARKRIKVNPKIKFICPFKNIGKNIPFRFTGKFLNSCMHNIIIDKVPEGSLVYAWPSVGHRTLQKLKEKKCKIFRETINIHTLSEKKIIETEMQSEEFFYDHYVTETKISNQIKSQALSDLNFVSNEHAWKSVLDSGVPEEKIFLTRYGGRQSNLKKATFKNQKTSRFIFIFVGRINMEKGVHKLLKAWEIANVDADLHLYGNVDTHMYERYKDLFRLKGVKIMGFIRDVHKAYSSADAFIFLSLAEGGPLVSIEAALHGLPMIVSPMGGGRIARNNDTALVVEPDNLDEVAQAIKTVFTEKELRVKLGESAQSVAKREFTWERAARERLDVMEAAS